jgi:hypothetical protein
VPKQRSPQPTFFEYAAAYEERYPHIAETMKRFTVVMETYQGALNARTGPRITIGNSTVRLDQSRPR